MRLKTTIAFCLFFGSIFGQLTVENSQSADYYVRNVLLGKGVQVDSIRHYGMERGMGQFDAETSLIGLKSGLVLSTGNADSIIGPNDNPHYSSMGILPLEAELRAAMRRGDRDLNRLCRSRTTDITIIEFDFIPEKNSIEFNYVFASEEYPEYAGSAFNDVFGFFISGPGIKGKKNLAVLPDGKTTVSVNNINKNKNKKYFRENSSSITRMQKILMSDEKLKKKQKLYQEIQFDGLTTVLKVKCDVIPFQTYHLKIAIGDVADAALDSGVFLEAGSLSSVVDTAGKYFKNKETSRNNGTDSIVKTQNIIDSFSSAVSEEFEITDIYFAPNLFVLTDSSLLRLDRLSEYLNKNPDLRCTLNGYTDNIGTRKYNQILSEKRALSVISYLISKNVERNRLNYTGNSFNNPKSENKTEAGRAMNRRVEIVIE